MAQRKSKIGFGKHFGDEFEEEEEKEDSIFSPDPHLSSLMKFIREHYRPAADYKDADLRLTTGEVTTRLQTFYQGDYEEKDVFNALQAEGFMYYDQGELDLVWLLKSY